MESDTNELQEQRERIDAIDREMIRLFRERMDASAKVAAYKKANGVSVLARGRERDVVFRNADAAGTELEDYVKVLYNTVFDLSRSYQYAKTADKSNVALAIEKAIAETPEFFPRKATVACQGVEGAFSQQACDKLFSIPKIFYCNTFEGVCQAVEGGLCQYGLLPIENSSAGSVVATYDLAQKRKFFIVRCLKLKVEQALLTLPGVELGEIREIASHEQALRQCSGLLKNLPKVKSTVCENTAVAARLVAESGRRDLAALASAECGSIYGLSVLRNGVQNETRNYTRFVCISKKLEIYPDSEKITFAATLPHRPGALYEAISRFAARGLNLCKIESRPIPGRDFEFQFYFDVEGSPRAKTTLDSLSQLEQDGGFTLLGAYREQN